MQPRGCLIRGGASVSPIRFSEMGCFPTVCKRDKIYPKVLIKRSSHRHSNQASGAHLRNIIGSVECQFLEPSRERENEMGILNIRLKLQRNKLKGNDLWSEL